MKKDKFRLNLDLTSKSDDIEAENLKLSGFNLKFNNDKSNNLFIVSDNIFNKEDRKLNLRLDIKSK